MRTFHFQHEWHLDAPVAEVFAALADVERYAVWWPQVRHAERLDDDSGRTAIRSFLPYTLDLVLRREVEDEATGLLRVAVTGDLEGWCQWRLAAQGVDEDACRAVFDQEATVTPRLLARSAPLTGPLLRANHAWMMRCGAAGLSAYLASARHP
ncbi:SRPBCC family protein [Pedococcus sp. 5OH_020]|uniref:SRPBCC family protein n=1 Tax=Pedococcus sp. 5OH_020 TaxID=2989814 RepID=UPI0022EA0EDE|nr:SRPBCC family protein [Pedococcus sp. 5OH_020]